MEKGTWFELTIAQVYDLDLTPEEKNRLVVYVNRLVLGLKICDLWSENYDELRGEYFEGADRG